MNIDFQILLDIIGFVQGTVLGLLLIILNKKKYKSTFFLGLFLLFFSLKLAHFISRNLYLSGDYPQLLLLPFNFSWLLFSLFFIYTQKVSIFSNKNSTYWILIPGVISFLIQMFIFFLPYQTKVTISENPWHEIFFTFIGIIYSWGIALWNLKLLNKHQKEVHNTFSQVEAKELYWARVFLIYSILASVLIHVLYFISPQNFYFKIFFSLLDLIAIYWISFHGVVQRNVLSILDKDKIYNPFVDKSSIIVQSIPTEDLQTLIKKIDNHLISTSSYTDTNLTIADIAKSVNIHPKRISAAINTVHKQNFNTYINNLRIKKAKLFLKNKELENLSIEGIGNEVGFHSKSAFYAAFKKITGTTPTSYREKLCQNC